MATCGDLIEVNLLQLILAHRAIINEGTKMILVDYFKRMMHHADLFDAMTQKLGVSDLLADGPNGAAVVRRAANRCLTCERGEACSKWLEQTTKALEAPNYCKNHDVFERLKKMAN